MFKKQYDNQGRDNGNKKGKRRDTSQNQMYEEGKYNIDSYLDNNKKVDENSGTK